MVLFNNCEANHGLCMSWILSVAVVILEVPQDHMSIRAASEKVIALLSNKYRIPHPSNMAPKTFARLHNRVDGSVLIFPFLIVPADNILHTKYADHPCRQSASQLRGV
jgi:hypothetical protein